MAIKYYGNKGEEMGRSPMIEIPANAAGTFKAGTVYQINSAGKLIAWAAAGTKIIGLCEYEQVVQADEPVILRELTGNIYLETTDGAARVIGATLDINTAGSGFSTSSNKDVRIVRNSSAADRSVFVIQERALALEGDA